MKAVRVLARLFSYVDAFPLDGGSTGLFRERGCFACLASLCLFIVVVGLESANPAPTWPSLLKAEQDKSRSA